MMAMSSGPERAEGVSCECVSERRLFCWRLQWNGETKAALRARDKPRPGTLLSAVSRRVAKTLILIMCVRCFWYSSCSTKQASRLSFFLSFFFSPSFFLRQEAKKLWNLAHFIESVSRCSDSFLSLFVCSFLFIRSIHSCFWVKYGQTQPLGYIFK